MLLKQRENSSQKRQKYKYQYKEEEERKRMKDKHGYNDGLLRWRENKDEEKQTLIEQPVFGHLETLLLLG